MVGEVEDAPHVVEEMCLPALVVEALHLELPLVEAKRCRSSPKSPLHLARTLELSPSKHGGTISLGLADDISVAGTSESELSVTYFG